MSFSRVRYEMKSYMKAPCYRSITIIDIDHAPRLTYGYFDTRAPTHTLEIEREREKIKIK